VANPYEASPCQETNSPYERIFLFFSAFSIPAQSAVGLVFGLHFWVQVPTSVAAPHTYRGSIATAMAMAAKHPVLCDLEIMLGPCTVLFIRVAKRLPLAS
jgi:hypothetical protein